MNPVLALVAGFCCGFASSAPVGPINLWVASSALSPRHRGIAPFLGGVVVVDLGWALLAQQGAAAWWGRHDGLGRGLGVVGGIVLLVLGLALWRRQHVVAPPPVRRPRWRATAHVLQGMALCASTPALPAFWVLAITCVTQVAGPLAAPAATACFLAGIALGDVLWFSLVVRVVRWFASGPQAWGSPLVRRLHRGAGVVLMLLGLGALVSTLA
jgi:threonine/homoserine/homoserine lactone efflux protein